MLTSFFLGALVAGASAATHPLLKRHTEGDCSPEPAGVPGYVNDPDTPDTFLANPGYSNAANGAATPSGYSIVFQNQHAAATDPGYLGVESLQSYDPAYCAQQCNSGPWPGCKSFDIYFERDATLDVST